MKLFGFKYMENKTEKFYVFEEKIIIDFLRYARDQLLDIKSQLLKI